MFVIMTSKFHVKAVIGKIIYLPVNKVVIVTVGCSILDQNYKIFIILIKNKKKWKNKDKKWLFYRKIG